jgi:hypothetical protein
MADPLVEETLDILTLIDARHLSAERQPAGYLYDYEELKAVPPRLTESL